MTHEPSGLLAGKRLLITGVVTTDSIAFHAAATAQRQGAEVLLTSFDRDRERTEEAAGKLPEDTEVLQLDVTAEADFDRIEAELRERWGRLDGTLHAVAFAPRDALAGGFLDAGLDAVQKAFATSTYSYAALARLLAALAPPGGGSIVGLDFDAGGAWPVYNWMGVCKTALQSVNRYVARDLGARRIRSNLVAAGPLHTRAAGGIPDFDLLTDAYERRAPLAWDPTDAAPVGDTVAFLFSDLSRAITGEVVHVDGGYNAMAADLAPDR
ncbi:MAG: enoyl-ACP reductase FabI [Microthrixaceae bacterium]